MWIKPDRLLNKGYEPDIHRQKSTTIKKYVKGCLTSLMIGETNNNKMPFLSGNLFKV